MSRNLAAASILIVTVVISALSCSRLNSSRASSNLPGRLFAPGSGASPIDENDKLSDNCLVNDAFDGCIFLKSPVAQEGAPVSLDKMEGARKFGVSIRGLSGESPYLENGYVKVHTLRTSRASVADLPAFKDQLSPSSSAAEQLSAYYWANAAVEYFRSRLAPGRVPVADLKIYVDDVFSGFSSSNRSVHLERKAGAESRAFSADVIVHLVAQAIVAGLSDGHIFPGSPVQHKACGQSPTGCCASDAGCSQALASAFGDYAVAMMFPGAPRVGESVAGAALGQPLCGWRRDLQELATRTATESYSACTGALSGRVELMGAWYAARWWSLRQRAEANAIGTGAEIDAIFFEHARAWTGTTTFVEAKSAALAVASIYKGGKHVDLVGQLF